MNISSGHGVQHSSSKPHLTMAELEKMAEYTDGRHAVSRGKKRTRVESTTQRTSVEHKHREQDTVRTTNRETRDNVSGKVKSKTEVEQIHERSISRSVTVECQNEVKELVETFTTATIGLLTALTTSTSTSKHSIEKAKEFVALGAAGSEPYPETAAKALPGFAWSSTLPLDEAVASFTRTWQLVHLNAMVRARRCFKRYLDNNPNVSGCAQVVEFCACFLSSFSAEMLRCGFFCRSLVTTFFVKNYLEIRGMLNENEDGDSGLRRKVNAFVDSHPPGGWLDYESNSWHYLGGTDLCRTYGDRVNVSVSAKRASMKFFHDTIRGDVTEWLNTFVSIRLALRCYNNTDRPAELLKWLPENEAYSGTIVDPQTVNPLWPNMEIQQTPPSVPELVTKVVDHTMLAKLKRNINLGPSQTRSLVDKILSTNHYVVVRMKFGNSGNCRAVEAMLRHDLAVKVLPLELFSDDSTTESTLMLFANDMLHCHKVECSRLDATHFGGLRAQANIVKNKMLLNLFNKLGVSHDAATERSGRGD